MRKILCTKVLLCLCWIHCFGQVEISTTTTETYSKEIEEKLNNSISTYSIISINVEELKRHLIAHPHNFEIFFSIPFYDKLRLTLSENEIRSNNFRAVKTTDGYVEDDLTVMNGKCNTYKGFVNNDPSQFVRLYIDYNTISGVIFEKNVGYIEIYPLSKFINSEEAKNKFVLFKHNDLKTNNEKCDVTHVKKAINDAKNNIARIKSSACLIAEVATDADYEWYQTYGSFSNAYILSIINIVDGVYSSTFNTRMVITFQNYYTTSADPYSGSTTSDLLNEFRNYWNTNRTSIHRDLAHLFTGRNFGSSFGVASYATLCDPSYRSYGLTVMRPSEFETTAHEIGHNFGADHPSSSECSASNTIMCENTPKIMTFSSFSQGEINSHLSSYSACLSSGFIKMLNGVEAGTIDVVPGSLNQLEAISSSRFSTLYNYNDYDGNGDITLTLYSPNSHSTSMSVWASSTYGHRKVRLTAMNACGTKHEDFVFYILSFFKAVYPNPAKDYLSLEFNNLSDKQDLPDAIELINEKSTKKELTLQIDDLLKDTKNRERNTYHLDISRFERGVWYLHAMKKGRETVVVRLLFE